MPHRVSDIGVLLRLVISLCARIVGLCSGPKPFHIRLMPACADLQLSSFCIDHDVEALDAALSSLLMDTQVPKPFHIPTMPARADLRLFSIWPKFGLNLMLTSSIDHYIECRCMLRSSALVLIKTSQKTWYHIAHVYKSLSLRPIC